MGPVMGVGPMMRRAALAVAAAGALLVPLACDSGPTGVDGHVNLVLQPVFSAGAEVAATAQLVDRVHVLIQTDDEVVIDSIVGWPTDQSELTISITVSVQTGTTETFGYTLQGLAGETVLFEMAGSVDVTGTEDADSEVVTDTFDYVGPGAEAVAVSIPSPPATILAGDDVRLTATVTDAGGGTVSAPIVWSTEDASVATVDTTGRVLAAHVVRATAVVIAKVAYRDLADTARIELLSDGTVFLPDAGPDTLRAFQDTLTLRASALGSDGAPAGGGSFTFVMLDTAVAQIVASTDSTARVRSRSNGSARIVATDIAEGYVDTATVVVEQRTDHVTVTPGSATFEAVDDTIQLSATVYDYLSHAIEGAPVSWSSTAPAVIDVDAAGRAWALQVGIAGIVASSGGVADTASLGVEQALASFDLVEDSVRLDALEQDSAFTAAGFDANGNVIESLTISWTSTDPTVADVDQNGVVTARSQGTVSVIASGGTLEDTATVVVDQRVATLNLAPAADTLDALQDTVTFSVEMLDPEGHPVTDVTAAWSCSDAAVLECGTGSAVAVGTGTADVIATVEGVSDSAQIHVRQVAVTLDVLQDSVRFDALQDRDTLTLNALDANDFEIPGTGAAWTSRATAIATVDTAGVVTAEGNGETWIVASSSGLQDSVIVRVEQVPANVAVSPADTTVVLEADALVQVTYSAEVTDANGVVVAGASVTWASSDTDVAQFSAFFGASTVTAVGAGVTDITATTAAADSTIVGTARLTVQGDVAEVDVIPSFAVVDVGAQLGLTLMGYSDAGDTIVVPGADWTSDDPSIASMEFTDTTATVTGVGSGVAAIAADAQGYTDTAFVAVAAATDLVSTAFAGRVDAKLTPGTSFKVPVTLDMSRVSADGDLGSVQFELGFDPAIVTYDSATVAVNGSGSGDINLVNDSTLSFAYAGTSPQGSAELTLVTIHFTVQASATVGAYTLLDLTHTARPSDTSFNEYQLPLTVDGRILVIEP